MSRLKLAEAKNYLRVDYDDDDTLILALIDQAYAICADVKRDSDDFPKIAVCYALAYLFEHREECDFNHLKKNLRSLLQDYRESRF